MDKRAKSKSGFTIIETVLFLALMGLIFLGAVVGTNGSISQQRYRDAVEQFVSDLKDIQSQAENIEIQDRGYSSTHCLYRNSSNVVSDISTLSDRITDSITPRGRSNCAQYGAVTQVVANGAKSRIYSYGLKGADSKLLKSNKVLNNTETDAFYLKHAMVHADYDNGFSERNMLWGTEVEILCDGSDNISHYVNGEHTSCQERDTAKLGSIIVMTYRSPITGNMKNFIKFWDGTEEDQPLTQGQDQSRLLNEETSRKGSSTVWPELDYMPGDGDTANQSSGFHMSRARFCINAGNGMTYENGGRRMVEITAGDAGAGSIHLYEADDGENKCNE